MYFFKSIFTICISNTFTLLSLQSTVFYIFVGKVKPTQCYFRVNAINRAKQYSCETDEIMITEMELFLYFTNYTHLMIQKL